MSVTFDHNLGSVWDRSGGTFNGMQDNIQRLAWLTPRQRCEVERLRQAFLLFSGRHREFFISERRTQFAFPPLGNSTLPFFAPFNVLGLMSRKIADLLFGESARFTIDDQSAQQRIESIVERSWLTPSLHAAAVDQSWAGRAYLEITVVRDPNNAGKDEALIGRLPPNEFFPIGLPGADRQYSKYIRYSTTCITGATKDERIELLLETVYTAGRVERKIYRLDLAGPEGPTRTGEVQIALWPARQPDGTPLPAMVETHLSRPNIVCIPNDADGVSDYDGLIELQDALNAKNTQIARVLAKHADPKLAVPEENFDTDGNFPASAEVIATRAGGEKPEYIVWDAELAAASDDRKFALSALSMGSEVPLSLLGMKDDASVESASKMRLNAASALAKAARKAGFWQPAIRLALAIAIEGETGAKPAKPIGVALRDGLPVDLAELANAISLLRSSNALSQRRSLALQGLERGEQDDEMNELDEEAKKQMPSVLLGEPSVPGRGAMGQHAADTTSADELAA